MISFWWTPVVKAPARSGGGVEYRTSAMKCDTRHEAIALSNCGRAEVMARDTSIEVPAWADSIIEYQTIPGYQAPREKYEEFVRKTG